MGKMGILNSKLIQALVLAVCLSFSSCVKEGGLSPKVLEGKWNATFFDNESVVDEDIYWEFEDDGDFKYCYDNECYSGDWEWNSDKTELDININFDGDIYRTEFEVDVLDKEALEGDWVYDGYVYPLEFVRD